MTRRRKLAAAAALAVAAALVLFVTVALSREESNMTKSTASVAEPDLDAVFVSATKQFEVPYPANWVARETLADAGVVLASDQAALDRYMDGAPPASADLIVNVGFLPATMFEQPEFASYEIRMAAAPEEFLRSALAVFHPRDAARLSGVDRVALAPDQAAARISVTAGDRVGAILSAPIGDRVTAVVSVLTAPAGQDAAERVGRRIAAGVTFEGDAAALYRRLLTG